MGVETLKVSVSFDGKQAIAGYRELKQSQFNLTEEIKRYQSLAFTEKDGSKVATYNRRIQELQATLKQTTAIGKQGFDEMGVAIEKASGNPLGKAFSGLRSIAYILPGIGIAGIFNAAFSAIGEAVGQMGLFAKAEDGAAKSAAEFNKELLKQRESAEGEASHLRALIDVAQNSGVSSEKRLQAVKELRKEYPGYFKDLTNEQILTGDITKATDLLTKAIYARAEARAREADIAKKATQVFENQQKIDELNSKLTDRLNVKSSVKTGFFDFKAGLVNEQSQNIANDLIKDRNKLLIENRVLEFQIYQSQQRVNSITAETIVLDETAAKATKKKTDALKEYWRVHYEQIGLQQKAFAIGQEATDKTQEAPTHITDRGTHGSGIFDEDFTRMATKAKKDLDNYNEALKYTNFLTNSLGDSFYNVIEAGQNLGETLRTVFIDLAKQIGKALIKALLFQAIGSALGIVSGGVFGKGFGDVFKGLLGLGSGHAGGALTDGPRSGHIELLHGKEWVLRPEQLDGALNIARKMGSMQGSLVNGSQPQALPTPHIFMKGSDFWLMYQQSQRLNQRGY